MLSRREGSTAAITILILMGFDWIRSYKTTETHTLLYSCPDRRTIAGRHAGSIGNSNPTSGESIAFAVMYHQADLGGLTFAHEVGHVLGMAHHYQSSGFTPPYPWSYGHVAYPDASHTMGFVTTMAYTGFCGGSPPCFKVPYYSNPAITIGADPVQGRPIGNSSIANNAQTETLVAPIVAGYRSPPPPLFADGFES
jgi:hypothetical protein